MSSANWNQVQEIFFRAADLPIGERNEFLDSACHGDPSLRSEIESLLKADSSDDSLIAQAIGSEVSALLNEKSLVGTRMGPYRLLKEIGRGGMGTVYLGERDDDQYRKQVAIKVVKRGMDSAEVLARFRHERQILAGLEHPYIARLIDGGTTPDDRPFFVMECVEGQAIDTYCNEHHLDVEQRLRLFLRVCEAVSYAHRALVVHRDLKPGNIIVAKEGVPKLLDFGVAKLLDPATDPGLTGTSFAAGPLTPEYASPEQIRGLPITTSADVYALGAVLFELLTGRRAQKITTHTPSEIEHAVCETDTPRPSVVARSNGAPHDLDSDLDNIVLMAMRKDPERRYGSVSQLAEDIERYLDGRPVLARQDSVLYRAQKFVQRNKAVLAAAALIMLSLLGGMILAERQARRAETERRFAESQRQSAERERARAEAQTEVAERERARAEAQTQVARMEKDRSERRLSQMIELANSSLFDVHTAIERLPGATQARKQIVVTTLRFLENLSKDAGQDDALRYMLSASYFKVGNVLGYPYWPNLGDTKGALANYGKSVAFIEPLLAKDPNRSKYLLQWVQTKVYWATTLNSVGEQQKALEMARQIVPAAQRLAQLCPGDSQCSLAEGQVYSEIVNIVITKDTSSALRYSQLETQAMERAMKLSPNDRDIKVDLGTAYSQQAKVFNTRGNLRDAVQRYRQAAELREEALASNPSDSLTRRMLMITYGNMCGGLGSPMFPNLGDTTAAIEACGKALATARDLAKADANDQLAQYDLANALLFRSTLDLPKEQWGESLADLQQSDAILHKLLAVDTHSMTKLRALATVEEYEARRLEGLGKLDEAGVKIRQSLANGEAGLARQPSDLGFVSQVLASQEFAAEVMARQGDHPGSLETAHKAITRAESLSVPDSEHDRVIRSVAIAYQNLARVQVIFGNWPEGRDAAQHAVDGWRQLTASGSHRTDPVKIAQAEALLQDCNSHLH